jgi:hypothetical protein
MEEVPVTREQRLLAMQLIIEQHLDKIEKFLIDSVVDADYRLTLIARNVKPTGKDMDILLTLDRDVDAIISVVRRRLLKED